MPHPVPALVAARRVALLVFLAAIAAIQLRIPMRDDVAWLLHVAAAWLDGQRPYATLIEVNPPPIIWISMLPVLLARGLGAPVLAVAPVFFGAVTLGCAWLTACILRRRGSFGDRGGVFAVLAVVLLVLPAPEFGQREHLIAAASLPYLALRTGRGPPGGTDSLLAGVLVGLCCAMKPQFVVAFATLEACLLAGGRRPAWGAVGATAATGLLCVLATLLLAPDYLDRIVPLAVRFYVSALHGNMVDRTTGPVLLALAAALPLWWSHRRRLSDGGATGVLLAFAAGSAVAYFLQEKGWFYHLLPTASATALALASWLASVRRSALAWRRLSVALAAATLLALGAKAAMQQLRVAEWAVAPERTTEGLLVDLLRREGATRYVALSEHLSWGFPVVQMAGVRWATRFPSMWAVEAEDGQRADDVGAHGSPARWVARDFLAACPEVVTVALDEPLDYLAVLTRADPDFARAWTLYRPLTRIDALQVYRREQTGGIGTAPSGTDARNACGGVLTAARLP